ncbi:VanZ family protein [Planctomicrobium sp. SH527]|uniref:VanZ family protein n=1 Tax=Planctomicrobium sp. SH527 TaxID=3448123 RepID=UPI003F5C51F2
MEKSINRWIRTLVPLVWLAYAAVLFYATHMRIPPSAKSLVHEYDKLIHASAFFILTVLSATTFLRRNSRLRSWGILICLLLPYAALDEYLQGYFQRTPDINDWISDSIGILAGCLFTLAARKWLFAPEVELPKKAALLEESSPLATPPLADRLNTLN